MTFHPYSPFRVWSIFRILLTLFLLIRKRERFLFFKPLSPEHLTYTITTLGASFIKLAQVLATRNDFFPPSYLNGLKLLHDALPPMDQNTMQMVFDRAFVQNPFQKFEQNPIASASIGQVHIAWLHDGTKVAVKLRRERIARQVNADIKILTLFNSLFRPLFSPHTKHSIEAVIVEFATMIRKEVSLNQERANLEKFITVYGDMGIRFPKPFALFSSDDALVMSFEEGVRFDDKKSIEENKIDIHPIIDKLVSFYTEQMLVKGLFHADPHPGNLLISSQGELILLDFGMVKRIPNETRIAIIELLKAANEQDYERYVNASKRLGTVTYDAPVAALAEFTESMFEIFNNNALDSQSMQELAFEVLERTRDLPFKLPQEAIYILRVSAIIEGLGTTYIENFNGIKDILPILQRNIPRALGAKESIFETIIDEFKQLPMDIKAFKTAIYKVSEEQIRVELSKYQLEAIETKLNAQFQKVTIGITLIFASLFLLLYDHSYENISLVLFAFGVWKMRGKI